MHIRNPRDFWAGAIYLALAAVVLWIGRNYALGSSARMGPGYFPAALGSILAVFGVVSVGRSLLRPGEAITAFAWRPLVLVLGSVVLFGLLLDRVGVLIALPGLIIVSALASRHSRINVTSVSALVGLVAFCVIVFVKGLGVPMPLIGTW
ncbi:MAG: tripartite tricarboxylate transporter TctB family protein, partial [Xanthobacteraceae bacterium]|nr:tripartite tricarboxylate transporter TctB family protein [Xanthobacteraceae bacterium]